MIQRLGYTKPLYMLPFDHRGSFIKALFGEAATLNCATSPQNRTSLTQRIKNVQGASLNCGELTPDQTAKIIDCKKIIYEAYKQAIVRGVASGDSAILVDEQFGDEILCDANQHQYNFALCVEKSGQDEFDFEYGDAFAEHINKYHPTFVKALVRYNPRDDVALNQRQLAKLRLLSDFCKSAGYKFLVEVLIPEIVKDADTLDVSGGVNNLARTGVDSALPKQNSKDTFDRNLRPLLTIEMINQFQEAGVEPDIWKLEGMFDRADYEHVVQQAQCGSGLADGVGCTVNVGTTESTADARSSKDRSQVGVIILGRGDNKEHVLDWLKAGMGVAGIIGFAVGRTVFMESIKDYARGDLTRDSAIAKICDNFMEFCELFGGKLS